MGVAHYIGRMVVATLDDCLWMDADMVVICFHLVCTGGYRDL